MMKIALLQCYSSNNLGDGLLVEEAIELLQEAFGPEIDVTISASYPETFSYLRAKSVRSRPTLRGYDRDYLRLLTQLHTYDLVVGVGGGYLRFGGIKEAVKTTLVMLPQVLAAAMTAKKSVYLPQSVGPAPAFLRKALSVLFSRVDLFLVRDDRSLLEFPAASFRRFPDMALMSSDKRDRNSSGVDPIPVYSIRSLDGRVPESLLRLGTALGQYSGYVQSRGAGNDDTAAMSQLSPARMFDKEELYSFAGSRRVVVAVRLHAALMAINSGHYVVHLAYERKGYGAFQDLGLSDFVYSARSFDVDVVAEQVRRLLFDEKARREYDDRLLRSFERMKERRAQLLIMLRELVKR